MLVVSFGVMDTYALQLDCIEIQFDAPMFHIFAPIQLINLVTSSMIRLFDNEINLRKQHKKCAIVLPSLRCFHTGKSY